METRLELVGHDVGTPAGHADALAAVLAGEFRFVRDTETYDDRANADLISVLERRRGLPVSLSILWVAIARRLGWGADVLDVPGHVLVMIGAEAAPVIVDPVAGCVRVGAEQGGKRRRALELHVRVTTMAPVYSHAWWGGARLEIVDNASPLRVGASVPCWRSRATWSYLAAHWRRLTRYQQIDPTCREQTTFFGKRQSGAECLRRGLRHVACAG